MFKESSKSRGVFRTQASIYDGVFLRIYLGTYYFCNKSSITDVRLTYTQASENIEISKVRLSSSKSSRLLQRIAFSCSKLEINLFFKIEGFIYSTVMSLHAVRKGEKSILISVSH